MPKLLKNLTKQEDMEETAVSNSIRPSLGEASYLYDLLGGLKQLAIALIGLLLYLVAVRLGPLGLDSSLLLNRPMLRRGFITFTCMLSLIIWTIGSGIFVYAFDNLIIIRQTANTASIRSIIRLLNTGFVWIAFRRPELMMEMFFMYSLVLVYAAAVVGIQ